MLVTRLPSTAMSVIDIATMKSVLSNIKKKYVKQFTNAYNVIKSSKETKRLNISVDTKFA
jgi:hypothetical protein